MNKTLHSYLDYPVAISLIAVPFILGFAGLDAAYYWVLVVMVLLVVVLDHTTDAATVT